jgi:hypothetical protein
VARRTKENTPIHLHWTELRAGFLAAAEGKSKSASMAVFEASLDRHSTRSDDWTGGTVKDTVDWLLHGYFAEDIQHTIGQDHNIEQTSIVWNEEEGDVSYERLICGYDDVFLGAIQAPSLSGVKIMIDYWFAWSVPNPVIREYGGFCASLINSLMESGFDTEIDISVPMKNLTDRDDDEKQILIRVKDFGELLDYTDFSAMFSPTGMRHLIFCAEALAAEKIGGVVSDYFASAVRDKWGFEWDENNRVIRIHRDPVATDFPGRKLTEEAYEAGVM